MVLKKRCLFLGLLLTFPVMLLVSQELDRNQGDYVKRTTQVIKNLEQSQADSTMYGIQLLEFAALSYENGLYSFAGTIVDRALIYIDDVQTRTIAQHNKLLSKSKLNIKEKGDLFFINQEIPILAALKGTILTQYATCFDFLGYFPESIEKWYQNALIFYKVSANNDVSGHLKAYLNLARYYERKKQWSKALENYQEAIKLQKRYRILHKEENCLLHNRLVALYINSSQIDKAEKALLTLPKSQTSLGNAVTLNHRVNLSICKKDYAQATLYLKQVVAQYQKSLPTLSMMIKTVHAPEFMSGLAQTATLYRRNGQIHKALHTYKILNLLLHETMKEYIPYMVYTDKSHLWLVMKDYFNDIQQFAIQNLHLEGATGLLYENNQLKKNIFVNSPVELVNPAWVAKDNYVQSIEAKLELIGKNEISYQTQKGSDFIAKFKSDLLGVAYERDKLTYLRKNQYRKPFKGIGWKNVQETMNSGDAVLEFIEVKESADATKKKYGVLILTKQSQYPELVMLCSEDRLQRILNDKTNRDNYLAKELWKMIEAKLPVVNTLFISPTGLINTISFAVIKNSSGQYLCEKYNLHYLLNSEDLSLVNLEKAKGNREQAPKNIYLFGGADFGFPIHEISDVRKGFGYLPGSKNEVNGIAQQLKTPWKAYRFVGEDATEKNLRNLSWKPGVSVIHISTHGFYLPYDPSIRAKGINVNGRSGYFDPLLRTGLVLTGANYAWKDSTAFHQQNDCIITALDFGQMHFPYTELVVLSACNTGLGEIKDGEGVAGIQQTLRMSGVKSMILSLNEVPDKETVELMIHFYKRWQEGYSKSDAFIAAQRTMKNIYPNNPEKWGGFILIQ